MSEHTPTPWSEWDVFAQDGKDEYPTPHQGDIRLLGHDSVCIGIVFGGYASMPQCDKNAAFIVKAVNNHDMMVTALERARDAIRSVYHEIDSPAMPACLAAAWEVAELTLDAVSTSPGSDK